MIIWYYKSCQLHCVTPWVETYPDYGTCWNAKKVVSELKKYGTFITLNNMGIYKYISFLLKLLSHVQLFATPWSIQSMASLQARILEWVGFSFCRGSSQPRDWTQVSCIAGRFFTSWATRKAEEYWNGQPIHSPWDFPNQAVKLGSPAFQVGSLPTELLYLLIFLCNYAQTHSPVYKSQAYPGLRPRVFWVL